ncbi:uncharacterized protein LOC126688096 [Mercurialis annua]|uniref:uncharacterized protein LOC126688096 n=1 Tax=Mercurialis annua TaxID=3986 RepID=UPI00216002DD|nr:uncharacterized protein LOC126688096 [Mercurialis annua]
MALSLSSAMFIICLSVFVLAGDAVRDMPEDVPMPNTKLGNITYDSTRLGSYVKVATLRFPIFTTTTWKADCFQSNSGYLSINSDYSAGWIVIETKNAKSKLCKDSYEFRAGTAVIATDTFYTSLTNPHETMFFPTAAQKKEIDNNGIGVYLKRASVTKDKENGHDFLKQVVDTI